MGRHRTKGNADTPDRAAIAGQMLDVLDAACLELGERLELAYHGSFDQWCEWVQIDTPFTVEEARRLRAVFLAHRLFPPEVIDDLPRPWKSLWTIPAGRIGKGMPRHATAAKRVSAPEMLAARLLQGSPEDLSTDVYGALAAWLHERDSAGSPE